MANTRQLSPTDLDSLFGPMDRTRATKYAHTLLVNKNTPPGNVELVTQYIQSHPEKFLTDAEVNANPRIFRRREPSYRRRDRVYTRDGRSFDNYGNEYDSYGNPAGGWHDGGSDSNFGFRTGYEIYQQNRRRSFFSRDNRKSIDQPRSMDEIASVVNGINDPIRGRLYLDSIEKNPRSNPETVRNARDFLEVNRDRLATDEQIAQYKANRPQGPSWMRNGGGYPRRSSNGNPPRSFWNRFWKSQEEFDAMSPKEKKFFVRAYKSKDQSRNASYHLRVLTNKNSSPEDKAAAAKVVNDYPGMFFKRGPRDWSGKN